MGEDMSADQWHTVTLATDPSTIRVIKGTKVWLDGVPIKGLTDVSVSRNIEGASRVTLTLICNLDTQPWPAS